MATCSVCHDINPVAEGDGHFPTYAACEMLLPNYCHTKSWRNAVIVRRNLRGKSLVNQFAIWLSSVQLCPWNMSTDVHHDKVAGTFREAVGLCFSREQGAIRKPYMSDQAGEYVLVRRMARTSLLAMKKVFGCGLARNIFYDCKRTDWVAEWCKLVDACVISLRDYLTYPGVPLVFSASMNNAGYECWLISHSHVCSCPCSLSCCVCPW